MMPNLLLLFLSLLGLTICIHIWLTKKSNKKLVCLIGDKHCDTVVRGDYSNALGLSNELMGILYYGSLLLVYGFLLINPLWKTDLINTTLIISISLATLFSIYLLMVQFFKLKTTCEWCIASGLISIAIFLIVV